jgi:hypothetical protein
MNVRRPARFGLKVMSDRISAAADMRSDITF